mgnify:CR=1 FL=1
MVTVFFCTDWIYFFCPMVAVRVLKNVEGIGICELTDQDVVRHVMVQRIIKAYDDYYNSGSKGKKR